MKIVNLIGGLGNQMFQYAFALTLKEKFPDEEVLIDVSHYNYLFVKKIKSANLHNGYELEKVFPNANLKHATGKQLFSRTWYCPNYFFSRVVRRLLPQRKSEYIQPQQDYFDYNVNVYEKPGFSYYEGFWASVHYYIPIKEKLKHVFAHPEPEDHNMRYIQEMESVESVGIHVRRGDYLMSPEFRGLCEVEYYNKAIKEILKDGRQHVFYIFSNDIQWCKEKITPLLDGHKNIFVTENKGANSCWDMHLMRHCKELIIANSSFSWWAAFLKNQDGRVVAPKTWMNRAARFDIWEEDWILV